jgi:hypothetical protein
MPMLEEPVEEEPTKEESSTILMLDVPVQAKMVAIDAALGSDGPHVELVEARQVTWLGVRLQPPCPRGGTCLDLVVHSSGPT